MRTDSVNGHLKNMVVEIHYLTAVYPLLTCPDETFYKCKKRFKSLFAKRIIKIILYKKRKKPTQQVEYGKITI